MAFFVTRQRLQYYLESTNGDLIVAKDEDAIKNYFGYEWIVHHPDLLGGQPTVKGTRISVAHVLECLSIGMTAKDIAQDYKGFPEESVPEVLKFASDHLIKFASNNVAA